MLRDDNRKRRFKSNPKREAAMREASEQAKLMGARDAVAIVCEFKPQVKPNRLSPTNYRWGNNGSFSIILEPNGVRFNDFENGLTDHGAGIANLVMYLGGYSFADAMGYLRARYGLNKSNYKGPKITPVVLSAEEIARAKAIEQAELSRRVERVIKAAQRANDVQKGDVTHHYLTNRCITKAPEFVMSRGDLRTCHQHRTENNVRSKAEGKKVYEDGPTMIAMFRDFITDEPRAMQRQRLTLDGRKHPDFPQLVSLGPIAGCAFKITPYDPDTRALSVSESLIDALSLLTLGGIEGELWGLYGTSTFPTLQPLERYDRLTIFADNDEAGLKGARLCKKNWEAAGKAATILLPPDGFKDFNAYLQAQKKDEE